jgi:tryptophan synthase beta chain
MSDERTTFNLEASEMPDAWFNIMPHMVGAGMQPLPPLHPGTKEPISGDALAPLFPDAIIEQEVSVEPWISIPGEVMDIYRLWRPTPLYRATRLEQHLQTPAKIFFKYEGVSPAGSHKPNTAVPQAFYNKQAGVRRLSTETGAGQWGSSVAMAANFFGLEALVYMVKASFSQKPYRRIFMETFGATCLASPTDTTEAGRQILAEHPDTTGSLGIAISEAMEVAATNEDTNYVIGSVLNHVLLHQTIIGLETQKQMAMTGFEPDVIIGCVGGGSNYAGFAYPFMGDKLAGKKDYRFIAAEPAACPTLTKGKWAYDFGDTAQMTPLLPMYTLGHDFVPAPVHAGGLRYHGDAPSLCLLVHDQKMEAKAYTQNAVFDAAATFARAQGIIPAPEPSHAIRAAIDEAIAAREANEEKVILFNLCGHGFLDMQAYDDYNNGLLVDLEFDEAEEARALAAVPDVPIPG